MEPAHFNSGGASNGDGRTHPPPLQTSRVEAAGPTRNSTAVTTPSASARSSAVPSLAVAGEPFVIRRTVPHGGGGGGGVYAPGRHGQSPLYGHLSWPGTPAPHRYSDEDVCWSAEVYRSTGSSRGMSFPLSRFPFAQPVATVDFTAAADGGGAGAAVGHGETLTGCFSLPFAAMLCRDAAALEQAMPTSLTLEGAAAAATATGGGEVGGLRRQRPLHSRGRDADQQQQDGACGDSGGPPRIVPMLTGLFHAMQVLEVAMEGQRCCSPRRTDTDGAHEATAAEATRDILKRTTVAGVAGRSGSSGDAAAGGGGGGGGDEDNSCSNDDDDVARTWLPVTRNQRWRERQLAMERRQRAARLVAEARHRVHDHWSRLLAAFPRDVAHHGYLEWWLRHPANNNAGHSTRATGGDDDDNRDDHAEEGGVVGEKDGGRRGGTAPTPRTTAAIAHQQQLSEELYGTLLTTLFTAGSSAPGLLAEDDHSRELASGSCFAAPLTNGGGTGGQDRRGQAGDSGESQGSGGWSYGLGVAPCPSLARYHNISVNANHNSNINYSGLTPTRHGVLGASRGETPTTTSFGHLAGGGGGGSGVSLSASRRPWEEEQQRLAAPLSLGALDAGARQRRVPPALALVLSALRLLLSLRAWPPPALAAAVADRGQTTFELLYALCVAVNAVPLPELALAAREAERGVVPAMTMALPATAGAARLSSLPTSPRGDSAVLANGTAAATTAAAVAVPVGVRGAIVPPRSAALLLMVSQALTLAAPAACLLAETPVNLRADLLAILARLTLVRGALVGQGPLSVAPVVSRRQQQQPVAVLAAGFGKTAEAFVWEYAQLEAMLSFSY